jgi:hypothetical protein
MNNDRGCSGWRRLGLLAVLALSTVSLHANPISPGDSPVFQVGTIIGIALAILAEAICVILLLRRWRTPRLFLLWLIAIHLLTYPIFLALLWLSSGKPPALSLAAGEGLMVLIEGGVIYLLCRFAPSAKSQLPSPSVSRSLLASLAGNLLSLAAYPLWMMLLTWISHARGSVVSDNWHD